MKTIMNQFTELSKKTVCFLGKINKDGKAEPYATGVIIGIGRIKYLLTAKHVVIDTESGRLNDETVAFLNLKGKGVVALKLKEVMERDGVSWIFHSNPEVDMALIPFPSSTEETDILVISDDGFIPIESLSELYDIFFLSFQPGTKFETRVAPIFRSGTISRLNEDKTFYIDIPAFPGNSGSPVFLKPSPIRFDEKGISVGKDTLGGKFIGIIGEYIPYEEVAVSVQTGRPRIIFQENTGLSRVWSINYIREITESEQFKKQSIRIETLVSKRRANQVNTEKTK